MMKQKRERARESINGIISTLGALDFDCALNHKLKTIYTREVISPNNETDYVKMTEPVECGCGCECEWVLVTLVGDGWCTCYRSSLFDMIMVSVRSFVRRFIASYCIVCICNALHTIFIYVYHLYVLYIPFTWILTHSISDVTKCGKIKITLAGIDYRFAIVYWHQ